MCFRQIGDISQDVLQEFMRVHRPYGQNVIWYGMYFRRGLRGHRGVSSISQSMYIHAPSHVPATNDTSKRGLIPASVLDG